jgi:VCBS repeat-containing protein
LNQFSIDSNGVVSTTGPLDFETTDSYTLTIKVTDSANADDSTEVEVTVNNVTVGDTLNLPNDGDSATYTFGTSGYDAVTGGAGEQTLTVVDPNPGDIVFVTSDFPADPGHILIDFDGDGITDLTVSGVEELVIQAEQVIITGDMSNTGLADTTITYNGNANDNTFDASGMTSTEEVVANGDDGNDTLRGGAGDDTLNGEGDDDDLSGNGGNDTIDGGTGDDTVHFNGVRSQYTVSGTAGVDYFLDPDGHTIILAGNDPYTVTDSVVGRDGVDTLTDVEALVFDQAPEITSGAQSGTVTEVTDLAGGENVTVHAQGGTITYTDADLIDLHTASFVTGGVGYLGTFTLDPTDIDDLIFGGGGSVGWSFSVGDGALDYLNEDEFLIQTYDVTIDDGHGGTATETVTVTLNGTNDAPTLAATASASINENATAVTTVVALDADDTAVLTYSIVGGADAGLFNLASTGELTFVAAPNFENPGDADDNNVYLVQVQATDENGAVSGVQTISVTVNNVAGATFNGGLGTDVFTGTIEEETINGSSGNDTLHGNRGSDTIDGGSGNDVLFSDSTVLDFSSLFGGSGDDILNAGAGTDTLNGSSGNDRLIAGTGEASMTGGTGADKFIFTPGTSGEGTILDFSSGNNALADKVLLDINTGVLGTNVAALSITVVLSEGF